MRHPCSHQEGSPSGHFARECRKECGTGYCHMNEQSEENLWYRSTLSCRKRIVVKIGSSSLLHKNTGRMNFEMIDRLARVLSNLKNEGRDVILVSSGATAVGREVIQHAAEMPEHDSPITVKQALASVGQARLMMIYQTCFDDYNEIVSQVLMTKNTVLNHLSRYNIRNTFQELLKFGVIPIVNENDSVATYEYSVGDNDNLSAMVASLVHADLLILLSDIDGLYTDDPRTSSAAKFIDYVPHMNEAILKMGKGSTGSSCGTGGMSTKLSAARIATASGCDMAILNAAEIGGIRRLIAGENVGTLFRAEPNDRFDLEEYIEEMDYSG